MLLSRQGQFSKVGQVGHGTPNNSCLNILTEQTSLIILMPGFQLSLKWLAVFLLVTAAVTLFVTVVVVVGGHSRLLSHTMDLVK